MRKQRGREPFLVRRKRLPTPLFPVQLISARIHTQFLTYHIGALLLTPLRKKAVVVHICSVKVQTFPSPKGTAVVSQGRQPLDRLVHALPVPEGRQMELVANEASIVCHELQTRV